MDDLGIHKIDGVHTIFGYQNRTYPDNTVKVIRRDACGTAAKMVDQLVDGLDNRGKELDTLPQGSDITSMAICQMMPVDSVIVDHLLAQVPQGIQYSWYIFPYVGWVESEECFMSFILDYCKDKQCQVK